VRERVARRSGAISHPGDEAPTETTAGGRTTALGPNGTSAEKVIPQPVPPESDAPEPLTVRAEPEPVDSGPPAPTAPPQAAGGLRLGTRALALVQSLRPRQWVKNILVAAAPLAAGQLWHLSVFVDTAVAFGVFVMASAGGYLINDARDIERDRAHPTKCRRPIARGDVPVPLAYGFGVLLLLAAITVPAVTGYGDLSICVAVYVVCTLLYSNWLKHEPVIDLALVAAGFLLRSMGGGLAAEIPLSRWFLIVAAFGSLFMVAGKRYSEMVTLGDDQGTRPSLREYSASYLRFVWSTSAGVVIAAYCLWAFEVADARAGETSAPWTSLSIAPLVLGLLKFARDIDRGYTGEPEEIVLRDKGLLALGAIWLVLFGLGVLHV
jgi:decaprenyl-phosphate phosphoribosyltransferase